MLKHTSTCRSAPKPLKALQSCAVCVRKVAPRAPSACLQSSHCHVRVLGVSSSSVRSSKSGNQIGGVAVKRKQEQTPRLIVLARLDSQISPVRGRNYFEGGAFKRRRQYFLEGRCSHRHKPLQATVRGFSESSMWSLIPPARASDHMYPKPVLIRRFPLKSSLTSAPIMRWWLTTLCITFPLIRRWRLTISRTSALQFLQSKFCKNFTNQAELVTEVTRWRSIALLEPSPSSGNGG